eukprot:421490-Hanusia_phi.AAC.2
MELLYFANDDDERYSIQACRRVRGYALTCLAAGQHEIAPEHGHSSCSSSSRFVLLPGFPPMTKVCLRLSTLYDLPRGVRSWNVDHDLHGLLQVDESNMYNICTKDT